MNNKKLGTAFEQTICKKLAELGYWVHFLTPDARGAQPFDIIAVKDSVAMAIECKTLSTNERYFRIDRLEENQKLAFEKWISCGNASPIILIEYGEQIRMVSWKTLKEKKKVDMTDEADSSRGAVDLGM